VPRELRQRVLLIGVAGAAFGLARHAFMTTFVPVAMRARALSTLGGSNRLGAVLGPLAGAALLSVTGQPASVVILLALCCFVAALLLVVLPDPGAAALYRAVATDSMDAWLMANQAWVNRLS